MATDATGTDRGDRNNLSGTLAEMVSTQADRIDRREQGVGFDDGGGNATDHESPPRHTADTYLITIPDD